MRRPFAPAIAALAAGALAAWAAGELAMSLIAGYFMAEYGLSSVSIGASAIAYWKACVVAVWIVSPLAFCAIGGLLWRAVRPRKRA
ncbi:hypothetical protein [Lysobacter sp. Root690]|uniref:hypothetical protein n=1 Tax=Lysobacter sp. Root690 TaxID=1736588 RepID=UPI0006F302D1|nr:hypothetical protein [Lysobacter sp. Root690]KRB07753.1 hypothetical protein ASD86_07990 [Lysobacter sp. Root690]